jgi:hypothetical protein
MANLSAIFKRELVSYFITPIAYVFILVFFGAIECLYLLFGSVFRARPGRFDPVL